MLPPREQHGLAYQLEPWGELQRGILKLLLERIGGDVLSGLHLVLVRREIHIGLDEENVVNCAWDSRGVSYTERDMGSLSKGMIA
jgi:hypothetical protein